MTIDGVLVATDGYLSRIGSSILEHSPDIFVALCILLAFFVFYKATSGLFHRLLFRSHIEDAFARLLVDNVYKIAILIIALITAASQVGINIVAPLAGIGILGIAIGFAAQDSLSNIIAGFLIFFDKPFRVHDYVTIGDHYGRIELITMRSTRIRTQDNKYVVIPNQKIINDVLVDHTTNGDTRINIPVSITYESSIEEARDTILTAFREVEGILVTPEPDVVVDKLGDSGVHMLARFWIPNAASERKYHFRMTELVKKTLDERKIQIAYPHVQVISERQRKESTTKS